MNFKINKFTRLWHTITEEPLRVSKNKINEMVAYLRIRGVDIVALMRLDAPWWYITLKNDTKRFYTNREAYLYLIDLVAVESKKEYQEWWERKKEKINAGAYD